MKLEWSATAPGTGAFNQEHNGWTAYPPGGSFHISPPSKRGGLWRVMYAAENAPVRGHHSGLWHDVGSVKTAASAKKMAGEFYSEFVHPAPWAANPTPNLEHWAQASQREHTGPRGGKTKKPSPRLVQRRLKTHHQKVPGVWANPLVNVKVKSPAQRGKAAPSRRLVARRKTTEKAPAGFYANPAAVLYCVWRMDANGQPAYFMRAERSLKAAKEYAQSLANKGGIPYGIIKKPL